METAKPPLLIRIAIWALILVLGFYTLRSCKLTDENSKLRGEIKILKVNLADADMRARFAKEAFDKTIAEKDLEIIKWREGAAKGAEAISAGNEKIKKLEEEIASLDPADKDALILKQQSLIETLEGNLTLSASVIETQKKEILAWEVKFDACREYTVALEKKIFALEGLVKTQGELIKGLEIDLRFSRSWGTVKTILVGAAAGFILYREVKK
jgi:chromosome segregation ATPase